MRRPLLFFMAVLGLIALLVRPSSSAPTPPVRQVNLDEARKFWSLAPLSHPAAPNVKDAAWGRTPIDRFVQAKLEEKGLALAPVAEREKLIRRASFDLTGLPPTPEETAAFVNDASPDAWGKLIDRLLDSPRYGERWARHWLDVTRFAESDGFEHDSDRPAAYQFRDFVIRALNDDMPFDQFVQWQLAGDETAPDNWQALAATGMLTAGVLPTQITEKEFEFTRYSQLDDMISTVGNSMLGLTIGCARCHDHKFDPISCKDYYRFAAGFATAIRNDIDVDVTTPAEREQRQRETEARQLAVRTKIEAFDRDLLPSRFDGFLAGLRQKHDSAQGVWSVLDFQSTKTMNGSQLVLQPDHSLLKVGPTPDRDAYILTARSPAGGITALRLQALTDKSLPHNGPGAADNGNFSLTEIEISAAPADGAGPAVPVKIASATATHQQNTGALSVASSFDGNSTTGWAVDFGGIGKDQAAIFQFAQPVGFSTGTLLTITLHFDHPNPHHLLGRARLAITTQPNTQDFRAPEGPDPVIADLLTRAATAENLNSAQTDTLRRWYADSLPEYRSLQNELAKAQSPAGPLRTVKVQVTSEGLPPVKNFADDRGYPHFYKQVYLLKRGDPNNKVEPVSESFPAVLMRGGKDESYWQKAPPPGWRTSYRRRALANWMTDDQFGAGNLLARVIVNRLWQHHFGRGIVATPNDFGAQGERPTHPELLDWLASDLIEHGWKLKRLHKLMMMSSVYKESSHDRPECESVDPHNIFLWRWQPRRLEAEPIRDSLLAVAGVLDPTMYGPGTLDPNMRRRSIYFTVKRSQLVPMLMVLDWPEALNSIGVRPSTTIAPQALLFLNSPQARQYAEAFSRRLNATSIPAAIEEAYGIALARKPSPEEVATAAAFIEKDQNPSGGDSRQAALTDFCQALLCANEFVYVE